MELGPTNVNQEITYTWQFTKVFYIIGNVTIVTIFEYGTSLFEEYNLALHIKIIKLLENLYRPKMDIQLKN